MIIAVASGKGGTGKTTISIALAMAVGKNVQLLDADVEEPNVSLFLNIKDMKSDAVTLLIPNVNTALCNACGKCSEICQYNAIANLKTKAMIFEELCHSCGGCSIICPRNAITELPERIGCINSGKYQEIDVIEGRIDIGHIKSPSLIKALKKHIISNKLAIIDCPPGTSCPMVTAVNEADYIILVTEPTPFGLNDLIIAIDTIKLLKIPFSVIINKYDTANDCIEEFCKNENIKILGKIPEDREIAKAYSEGISLLDVKPVFIKEFKGMAAYIINNYEVRPL